MLNTTFKGALAGLAAALFLTACSHTEPPPPPAPPPPPPPVSENQPAPVAVAPVATIVPGSQKDFEVNVGDRVFFMYDKSDVDDTARNTLQKQAAWLAKYPGVTLSVEGHCDERGTREYNLALGARRAAAAKEYLVSLGVASSRLETISYGKERPVCADSTEACYSQNRRAVSVIKAGAAS